MEHTSPTEIISQQVQRLQRWFDSNDLKGMVRRFWTDNGSEQPSAGVPSEDNHSKSIRSEVNPASGNEWSGDRTSQPDSLRSQADSFSAQSDSLPTRAELDRLENGRPSSHSIVFLDDSELEEIFEPTVRETSAYHDDESGIAALPDTIGDELAERMLRSATGDDPDYHH